MAMCLRRLNAPLAVKSKSMEKEIYYCLSDNCDLGGLYLRNMDEVKNHILNDLGDIHPKDRTEVVYTIKIVEMTEDEFNNLPEYDG